MRVPISMLVGVLGISLVLAQVPSETRQDSSVSSTEQKKSEQELIQLEREWIKADLTYDIDWYERHLAAEYVSVGVNGDVATKKQEIESAKARTQVRESHAVDDMKVRLYGSDVAVVTGRVSTRQGPRGGKLENYQLRFTDVFVRRDGRWQVVANQNTRIATAQSSSQPR